MKKIILLLLVSISFLFAEINEYDSDVYFANGINTDSGDAKQDLRRIDKKFKVAYPDSYKCVANWKVSLNHTQGMGIDLYESMLQKIDEDWRISYALLVPQLQLRNLYQTRRHKTNSL